MSDNPSSNRSVAAASSASTSFQFIGVALIVVSTISIAIVPTLARLAYDGGANTLTLITARSILSLAITSAMLSITGRPFESDAGQC